MDSSACGSDTTPMSEAAPASQRPLLAPHQERAAARLLRDLAGRGGALLADEVGLGKSFVACAVAAEMIRRGFEVEVIVPAPLTAQWSATLAQFAIQARVFTHDGICSDPFVPDPARRRFVIVDEAHRFRNPATQRYSALARRSIGARLLLLTATPICNSLDDLYALLALILADDALRLFGINSIDRSFARRDAAALAVIVRAAVVRRGRDVLPSWLRIGRLRREVVRHEVFGAQSEIEALRFPLIGEAAPANLLRRLLWRRLESSEAALLETLERQRRFYRRALDALAGGRTLTKSDYRRLFGRDEAGEMFQEVLFWDLWLPNGAAVAADAAAIREELARLEALRKTIERSPRSKRGSLLTLLAGITEPALIFTGAIATARELYDALRGERRCGLVTSRQARDPYNRAATPEQLFALFAAGKVDVLIATDLAGEGLDLQTAGVVIHYDLPWNPARLDQRNGRAWRIGQQHDVVRAIYFLPERASDESEIVTTLAAKNRTRHRYQQEQELEPPIDALLAPSRLAMRPYVPKRSPQERLLIRLRRERLLTSEAFTALARRYPAGIERMIDEMSGLYLDEPRIDALRECLAAT
jgi:superfamily II DNA or RNA helicase